MPTPEGNMLASPDNGDIFARTLIVNLMEIVILEKRVFDALIENANALARQVETLKRTCGDYKIAKWLDGEQVCRLLRISQRQLQTMRDKRIIGCTRLNRRFFYKPQEVERLIAASASKA